MKKRVITITISVVLAIALCSLGVENVRLTDNSDHSIIEDVVTESEESQYKFEVTNEVSTTLESKNIEQIEEVEAVENTYTLETSTDGTETYSIENDTLETESIELTKPVEVTEISVETVDSIIISINNKDSLTQIQNDTLIVTPEVVLTEPIDSLINQIAE